MVYSWAGTPIGIHGESGHRRENGITFSSLYQSGFEDFVSSVNWKFGMNMGDIYLQT